TPGKDGDDQTFNTILTAWVNHQPDTALDWVKAQPDSEFKNKALETCIGELTKTDAPKALALAASFPEGSWRNTIIAGVFTTWATNDLAAATTACQQLPDSAARAKAWESVLSQRIEKDPATAADDVKNLPPGDFRQNALEQLCDRWGSTNAPAALAWAQSLPSATEQTAVTNRVVAFWAGKEPQAAMQFAGQHPELSGDVIMAIAEACSQNDFTAATNWFASLPDGDKKDAALLGLARTWVQTDPKSMAVYALGLPAGDTQTRYLTVACRLLAKHDLPGTVEVLKPLADAELKQTILEQVGSDFDLSHMDQAAKSIATPPAGDH
ncbi:MAG: hypothetical protein JF609_10605, partial [Verrucomicrobia bacterium]|nr:hypothetical protein [Verrucomicrobiota bacterium]